MKRICEFQHGGRQNRSSHPKNKFEAQPKHKRRKVEIVFDSQARNDYISGFHQRKEDRKKKALEEAARLEKEEKKSTKKQAVNSIKERYQKVLDHRKALASHFEDTDDDDDQEEMSGGRVLDEDRQSDKTIDSSNVREVSSEFYQTPGNVIITSTALDWNSFSQHNLAAGLAATTPPSEVPTSTAKVVATHAKPVAKKKSSIAVPRIKKSEKSKRKDRGKGSKNRKGGERKKGNKQKQRR